MGFMDTYIPRYQAHWFCITIDKKRIILKYEESKIDIFVHQYFPLQSVEVTLLVYDATASCSHKL